MMYSTNNEKESLNQEDALQILLFYININD